MRLLIVCYMLPPALYPTSIQMPRMLAALDRKQMAYVSGNMRTMATGLECYSSFVDDAFFNANSDYAIRLSGLSLNLARRFVPFYARTPDEFRGWLPGATRAVHAKLKETGFKPDLLITFSEPMTDHLLGLTLKRELGIPWIAQFSDPWSDSPFRRRQFLANAVNRSLERKVFGTADRLVFTSQETIDLVMAKYPPAWRDKTRVIVHAFDPALYPARRQPDEKLVVRFVGHFYAHRTPLPLFRALRTVLDRSPTLAAKLQVELVGRTPRWVRYHPAYRALPEGMVQLRPSVPYLKSLELMQDSDLLLVIEAPERTSVLLHSKIVDYVGAGAPIMGIVPPGANANLIKRLGGFVAHPLNRAEIGAELGRAIDYIVERRRAADGKPWGEPAVRAEYRIDRIAADFAAIVREAAAR